MKPYANKREVLEDFLANGLAMIHVDSRVAGVSVPPAQMNLPALRLNLSHRFADADVVTDDVGVGATLTFGGQAFRCFVPWKALYAVTSKVMNPPAAVFPDYVPPEVRVHENGVEQVFPSGNEIRIELVLGYAELTAEEFSLHKQAMQDAEALRYRDFSKSGLDAEMPTVARVPDPPQEAKTKPSGLTLIHGGKRG